MGYIESIRNVTDSCGVRRVSSFFVLVFAIALGVVLGGSVL